MSDVEQSKPRKKKRLKLPWSDGSTPGDRYYGEIAATYLDQRVHKPIWHAEQSAVEQFLSRLPNAKSVIDVPFGTGRFVEMYRAAGLSVSGIDASDAMLAEARKALGAELYDAMDIRVGLADSLPYPDRNFDLAVCVRFLESIIPSRDVPQYLRELRRVTSGHAIVRLNVRKPDAEPTSPPEPEQPLKGRLFEPDILALLSDAGWTAEDNIVVDVKPNEERRIWLLS